MITNNKKSVEQLFKVRLQSRVQKTDIREIDLNKNKTTPSIKSTKKKTRKQPVPEPEPEPVVEEFEESDDESENSSEGDSGDESSEGEIEEMQVKPAPPIEQKAKPVAKIVEAKKAPAKKAPAKKAPTKRTVQAKNSNIAVEIVDSMGK